MVIHVHWISYEAPMQANQLQENLGRTCGASKMQVGHPSGFGCCLFQGGCSVCVFSLFIVASLFVRVVFGPWFIMQY